MNVAVALVESPENHLQEIRSIRSVNAPALARLRDIADTYASLTESEYDARIHPDLLYEFKAAQERLDLYDDLKIARAIKKLTDPTGW